MKYVRLLIISFIVLFLLVTAISLFFPSHVHISRAVQVQANKDSILDLINNAANWKQWFPGADSAEVVLEDGKIKGIQTANSALVITNVSDSSVLAENRGPASKKGGMGWNVIAADNGSVTVQWFADFYLKWYPWEKFTSLLLDKSYGPRMERGLANLKTLVEN
ncbi:MAG: SRPBCC family protein [Chitinophagaceae bacterium]